MAICFGVLLTWSSPRMTKEMSASISSTEHAKLYVGVLS